MGESNTVVSAYTQALTTVLHVLNMQFLRATHNISMGESNTVVSAYT